MEVYASVTKPEICVLKSIETKPCHADEQPRCQKFLLDHRMDVTISVREDDGSDARDLVNLKCMYVNMDSQKDMEKCKDSEFKDIIETVDDLKMPLDNLVIVFGATITRKATVEDLEKACEKIHCIICRAASVTFNEGHDIGMYVDFRKIQPKAAKWLAAAIRDYTDGDMRKEVFTTGMYIHKIPWTGK